MGGKKIFIADGKSTTSRFVMTDRWSYDDDSDIKAELPLDVEFQECVWSDGVSYWDDDGWVADHWTAPETKGTPFDADEQVATAYRVYINGSPIGWVRKFKDPPLNANGNRRRWQWQRLLEQWEIYGPDKEGWKAERTKSKCVAALIGYQDSYIISKQTVLDRRNTEVYW